MTQTPIQEGTIPFTVPDLDKPCSTYYKIIGNRSNDITPMVYLHGGPGGAHDYLLPLAEQIWIHYKIPGILYDQIGGGLSTHLPEKAGDGSFWTVPFFSAELNNLLDHLKLRDGPGFHLLGQSWGGMLGSDFATTRPPGLRRLVLASGIASREKMIEGTKLMRAQLEPEQQATLNAAEDKALKGDFDAWDSPAVKEITLLMMKRHVCRTDPVPAEITKAFETIGKDPTVYRTM